MLLAGLLICLRSHSAPMAPPKVGALVSGRELCRDELSDLGFVGKGSGMHSTQGSKEAVHHQANSQKEEYKSVAGTILELIHGVGDGGLRASVCENGPEEEYSHQQKGARSGCKANVA